MGFFGNVRRFGGAYALDDLEEKDSQEGVDLGSFLVGTAHLRGHPAGECAGGFERAGYEDDAG